MKLEFFGILISYFFVSYSGDVNLHWLLWLLVRIRIFLFSSLLLPKSISSIGMHVIRRCDEL